MPKNSRYSSSSSSSHFLSRQFLGKYYRYKQYIPLEPLWPIYLTFGSLVYIVFHLRNQIPQNHPKKRHRHFQAKLKKNKNWHVIETTALILTKFCTVTKTTKYSSLVVQIHVKQIQDGRWLQSAISTMAWPICTKHVQVTHIVPPKRTGS